MKGSIRVHSIRTDRTLEKMENAIGFSNIIDKYNRQSIEEILLNSSEKLAYLISSRTYLMYCILKCLLWNRQQGPYFPEVICYSYCSV